LFKHGGLTVAREGISEVLLAPPGWVFCTHGVGIDQIRSGTGNPLPPTHIGEATW